MSWLKSDTVKILLITLAILGMLEVAVRALGIGATSAAAGRSAASVEQIMRDVHGPDWQDYFTVGQEQSRSSVYMPFVEYTSGPVDGQFTTVTEEGVRCNNTARTGCAVRGGADMVWVFGGSTTFGVGVKNDETIPAYLDRILPGHSVLNFGTISYYSTIERIRFLNLLTHHDPPAAAVFIDGLNDFYYTDLPDISAVSGKLRDTFHMPDSRRTLAKLEVFARQSQLVRAVFKAVRGDAAEHPPELRSDEQLQRVIERLERNTAMREAAGAALGTQVLTVLQPVPLYGAGHATSLIPEEYINYTHHVNSGRGYELIHEGADLLTDPAVLNLAEFGHEDQMYVDTVHYHPKFNRLIAAEISNALALD